MFGSINSLNGKGKEYSKKVIVKSGTAYQFPKWER